MKDYRELLYQAWVERRNEGLPVPGLQFMGRARDKSPGPERRSHEPMTEFQIRERIEVLESYPERHDWTHRPRALALRWALGDIDLPDSWFE